MSGNDDRYDGPYDYSLMPPRRPHVVLVEREPGKPHLRHIYIREDEPTRYAEYIKPPGIPADVLTGKPPAGLGEYAQRLHEWHADKSRRLVAVTIETAKAVLLASRGMGPKRRWVRAVHSKNLRIRRKGLKHRAASIVAGARMEAATVVGMARAIAIRSERPPWLRSFKVRELLGGSVSIGQRVRVVEREPLPVVELGRVGPRGFDDEAPDMPEVE